MSQSKSSQVWQILVYLAITFFVVFMYTFLHESGHALVGVLSGGTLTAFSVSFWDLSAHVGMAASLTPAQTVLNNLAGAGLPLLAWLAFMLAVPKRANLALEGIKVVGTLMFLNTLLAWVVLPPLSWAGLAPNDDVTNFVGHSGVHPLWVSGVALAAYLGGWLLFSAKIDGLRREIELFHLAPEFTPAMRRTLACLSGLLVVCGLAAFGANGFRFSAPNADPFQLPPGATLATRTILSETAHAESVVCAFTLTEPATVAVYLVVENVNSEYLEVRLTGPAHYDRLLLHAEGYTAQKDMPHMEDLLQPGRYACLLTSQASPGLLSVYTHGAP
jgi:hypothetical protein